MAILIKHNVPHRRIEHPDLERFDNTKIETISIELEGDITLVGVYIHPKYTIKPADIDAIMGVGPKVLAVGDWNATHPAWDCRRANPTGNTIYRYLLGGGNHNINLSHTDEPTFYPSNGAHPSTIDFLPTKGNINPKNLNVIYEMNSDHYPVAFTIPSSLRPRNKYKEIRTINWVDYKRFLNAKFNNDEDVLMPKTKTEIDTAVKTLIEWIQEAARKCSTSRRILADREILPANITKRIKNKNKTRRRYQVTRDAVQKRITSQMTDNIRELITEHRDQRWERWTESLSVEDSYLWRASKELRRPRKPIP